jgi:glucose/mannose-6-phosphate isomerase
MLDEIKQIDQIDTTHMLDTFMEYPNQINEALEIAQNTQFEKIIRIDNVIITGMGASGITGEIIGHLFRDRIEVPIIVNREYDLPKWAKKNSLTIFVSYSGNTEETLSSLKLASQRKCHILCISSAGKLQDMAEKRELPFFQVPLNLQPREAIIYLFFIIIHIFRTLGLIKNTLDADIQEAIHLLQELVEHNNKTIPATENRAKQVAQKIHHTIPQIYGWGIYSPISKRWRTQFNENSKLIAREDNLTECNHNDIVGWSNNPEVSKQFTCILFRDKEEETIYLSTRLEFMKDLFLSANANIIEVSPRGKSRLAKTLYLLCLGDFISVYLALLRDIDPAPIDVIKELKQRLERL